MRNIKFIVLSTLLFTCGVFTSCNKTSYDVMVVGVNLSGFEEVDILINSLDNKNKQTIDNINFYTGSIDNKKIAIVESPHGMSEAAMATTIGIKHFNPRCVINEGTAGGHADESWLDINDIILGKDILDMSSYYGDGRNPETWRLQNDTLHSDETLINTAYSIPNPYGEIHKNGIISSSDCWNNNIDFINALHNKFHEDCEEMESYAVTNVCAYYKIPSLSIRIISNNLIKDKPYDETAGKNIQHYTIDVIKAI